MFNVITLTNWLSEAGHDVHVTCIEPAGGTVGGLRPGIAVTGLGAGQATGWAKVWCRWRGAYRLRRHLRNKQFDLLYVVDSWTLPTLWLATAGALRWPRADLVYHTFDWLEPGLVAETHRRLERHMCRTANLVVNTDRARARMQQTLYGLRTKPLWVQNCLPANLLIPAPSEALRREMTGKTDTSNLRIIIYPTIVSNADSAQRMTWELIGAFRDLPENYHLVLFYQEGTEYRRCLAACSLPAVGARVKFLAPKPFQQLLDYVASADVGVILYDDSKSSGYFMCNADKMSLFAACGVPFVASDQPNLQAVTYRYALGECCNPCQNGAIAGALKEVADGRTPLPERKRAARLAFVDHLHFEIHGRRLMQALEAL